MAARLIRHSRVFFAGDRYAVRNVHASARIDAMLSLL
jgi:hypothetical protein